MTVRQAHDAVRPAWSRNAAHDFALRIVLAHDLLAIMRYQVVAVSQPPRVPHVDVSAVLAFGQ